MNEQRRALSLATLVNALCFAIWLIYIALLQQTNLRHVLSEREIALLLATPLLSAAVFSLMVSVVLQKIDSRRALSLLLLVLFPLMLSLSTFNNASALLVLGVLLGLASTAYLFGLDYLSHWLPRGQEGTRLGIYGTGDLGVLLTFMLIPLFIDTAGLQLLGPAIALIVLLFLVLFTAMAPKQKRTEISNKSLTTLLKDVRVWRFSLYNFFVFGSFLALLVWLPRYYHAAYDYSPTQAAAFTLIFATVSGLMRAIGGWFSDRYGGRAMNWSVFWACLVCLFFLSYPPTTMTIHGATRDVVLQIEISATVFSVLVCIMGAALGFGRASVTKLISDYYPSDIASVAGIANAVGALGACGLALLFSFVQALLGIHSAVFMLLYGLLALCMITMHFANKGDRQQLRLQAALENNFLELD